MVVGALFDLIMAGHPTTSAEIRQELITEADTLPFLNARIREGVMHGLAEFVDDLVTWVAHISLSVPSRSCPAVLKTSASGRVRTMVDVVCGFVPASRWRWYPCWRTNI